jgi:plasmid stability protein
MRTTLDLADDVLAAAKERARREHKTMGEVVSELVRQALTAPRDPAPTARAVKEPTVVYGVQPFASRGSVVTNELIDRLRSDDAY